MNEIKQEILDLLILNGRKPQSIKSGERVVYLYDALNIVNKEFSKTEQPQLNENQQILLDYLKKQFGKHSIFVKSIFDPISDLLSDIWIDDVDIAFEQLDLKQEIQVLEVFSQWALEQEEE